MRRSQTVPGFLLAGVLLLGIGAAPAASSTSSNTDPQPTSAAAEFNPGETPVVAFGKKTVAKSGVKATLVTTDLVNKKGKLKAKSFIKLTVTTPEPIADRFTGDPRPVTWRATIKTTGKGSCDGAYISTGSAEGSGVFNVPLELESKKVTSNFYRYIASGKCKVTADVTAYRFYTDAEGNGAVDEKFTVATNVYIRDKSKISASVPTKVKKNKTVKISGKATYVAATKKVFYKTKAVPSGSKVEVQFQKNGKGDWKKIKTAKIGKSGAFSTSIKLSAKGKVRAVLLQTNTRTKAASAVRSVKVTK